MRAKILIVDAPDQARSMASALVELRADVRKAKSTRAALRELPKFQPDLVITELDAPGVAGLEILEQLRDDARLAEARCLVVTSDPGRNNTLAAFDLGAADFLVKPYDERELRARVQMILRRLRPAPALESIEAAGLTLVPEARRASRAGRDIPLTPIEFSLLQLFVQKAGRALSRDYLLEFLWGASMQGSTRTIDMHISHLRSKLGPDGDRIETVKGVGYRFKAN